MGEMHNPGGFGGAGTPRPVVSSLDAATGVATTVVTITGKNFRSTAVVYLDGTAQATTFISATSISFVAAGSVASHTLTVRDNGAIIPISSESSTFEITA